ncbi:MAG: PEP-CTERM sorting domain-containing protein [Sutterellaceae bacterium]|nr:PEP-CTERM sorting domain-containing protein [Burkholderiaceae bacterium]MCX7901448.1 PEP-CTERM sorting domain-containing protein [Burkholderiaceae bacterium]MDW8430856.1 PEP-CTERM sorting domain-containing protein [Sutterellaceae bacterium]
MKQFAAFLASAFFCVAAAAVPLAPGQTVSVADNNGNPFTPSPVAGDTNGLFTNLTIEVNGSNVGVAAGLFSLNYNNGSGWEQLLAFCLSPDVWLQPFDNPYTVHALSSSPHAAVSGLISEFWGRFRNQVTNDVNAAAFQVGLWELAFDAGAGINLAGGNFRFTTSGAVLSTAQSWLSQLDGTGPRANLVVLIDNPSTNVRRQDLVTEVPEPGTLALLGAAVLLLAAVGRLSGLSAR